METNKVEKVDYINLFKYELGKLPLKLLLTLKQDLRNIHKITIGSEKDKLTLVSGQDYNIPKIVTYIFSTFMTHTENSDTPIITLDNRTMYLTSRSKIIGSDELAKVHLIIMNVLK